MRACVKQQSCFTRVRRRSRRTAFFGAAGKSGAHMRCTILPHAAFVSARKIARKLKAAAHPDERASDSEPFQEGGALTIPREALNKSRHASCLHIFRRRKTPPEKSICAICIPDLISTSLGRQKLPHSAAFGIFVFPSTPAKRRRSGNLLPTHARRAALRLRRNAACGGFAAALCPDRPAGGRGAPRISSVILIPNQYMEH